MSQVDQKRAFNKLKHDLEPWRDLIVQLNSVLTWEKNYYPAVVGGGVTTFFIGLWALDLSNVTMASLSGLFFILFDFFYPSFSRVIFNPDKWSGQQEAEFEKVCGYLCSIKMAVIGWYEYIFINKERKSAVFVFGSCLALLLLAWIGAVVNNMLLMYLSTITVCLYPGIQEKLTVTGIKEKIEAVVGVRASQFRDKAQKTE